MRKVFILILLFVFTSTTLCTFLSCAKKEIALATVGEEVITASELEIKMQQQPTRFSSFADELERKRRLLEGMAEQKLLLKGAYQRGFDTEEEILSKLEQQKPNVLLQLLYEREVTSKSKVNEAELKDFYKKQGEEIKIRHLLVKSKVVVDSLYQRLTEGEDFAVLAEARSLDPTSAMGGELGYFRWGNMIPGFREAAFKLKVGEISKPIKTQFGWHLIKLEDRRPVEQEPYEKVKGSLEKEVESLKQGELSASFLERLKENANFTPQPVLQKDFWEKYQSAPESLKVREKRERIFTEEELKTPVLSYSLGEWTLKEFLEFLDRLAPMDYPDWDDTEILTEVLEKYLRRDLLLALAERDRIDKGEEFQMRLQSVKEDLMAQKFRTEVLEKNTTVSEEELQEYYQENKGKFRVPAEYHLREISVKTEAEVKDIIQRLKRGEDFARLARENTLRTHLKEKGGDMGYLKSYQYPELYQAASEVKVGQISQPILVGGNWSVVKLEGVKEEGIRSFEEAKAEIQRVLLSVKKREAYDSYIDLLKQEFPITIDQEALEKTVDREKYAEIPIEQG
jgi:parvulin-like peptidyl-prolyl isomerase